MNSNDLVTSLLEQRVPLTLLIDLAFGVDPAELIEREIRGRDLDHAREVSA